MTEKTDFVELRGIYLLRCYEREADPRNWPEFVPTDGDDWDMQAAYSYCTWVVSRGEDGVYAEARWHPRSGRVVLPFHPTFVPSWQVVTCVDEHGFSETVEQPPQSVSAVLEVGDGYLVGYNSGEFGGGLYWYDRSGTLRQHILEQNVVQLVPRSGEVLAFTGIAHMVTDDGQAVVLQFDRGSWQVRRALDLTGRPTAFLDEPDGSMLVATEKRIVRVSDARRVELIHYSRWGFWGPNSFVKDADGTLYLGTRYVVVRLRPTDEGYEERWLAPEGATRPRPVEAARAL